MKFSIVTISFNKARFIEESLLSVLNQRGIDLEYIIVDAGSTDGSRTIIEKYGSKVSRIIFEPDRGPADGLNKGFAHATGDIYGYLNADDLLNLNALQSIKAYFENYPSVDVVSGHAFLIDGNGNRLHRVFSHKFDLIRYAAQKCVLIQPSTFFRARMFKKVGGFNIDNRIAWDGELAVGFALAGAKFAVAHEYWSCFRIYDNSISGSASYRDLLRGHYTAIRQRLGLPEPSKLETRYLWLTGWLGQPRTLISRIVDGLKYPKRVL